MQTQRLGVDKRRVYYAYMVIRHGMRPVKRDKRDYSFHRTFHRIFGTADPQVLSPLEYTYDSEISNPDQNAELAPEECTCYTITDIALDQDVALKGRASIERYFPGFNYMQTMVAQGSNGVDLDGADPRKAYGTASLAGLLKVSDSPFKIGEKEQEFIANYKNWPAESAAKARPYRRGPFFNVDKKNGMDWFDSFRTALRIQVDTKTSIGIGAPWFLEWATPSAGVIPNVFTGDPSTLNWHFWKLCGERLFGGETYLIAKTWQGIGYGDGGFTYYPRSVINAVMQIPGTIALTNRPAPVSGDIQTIELYGYEEVFQLILKILQLFRLRY